MIQSLWRTVWRFLKELKIELPYDPAIPLLGIYPEKTIIQKDTCISSVLCDHLEGWDRDGGREGDARGKRYGDICICMTDSLCYKAETNTPL